MSASKRPTLRPCFAKEIAIFTDVVDLPTPPFPELTIKKFFTCGAIFLPFDELSLGITGALILQVIFSAPSLISSAVASSFICCETSGADEVISTVKLTSSPFTTISFTKPKVTISLVNPGYITFDKADFTLSSVIKNSFTIFIFLGLYLNKTNIVLFRWLN